MRKRGIIDKLLYGKKKKNKGAHTYLEKELHRRDDVIRELKEKNRLLLNTTIKQSREIVNLQDKIKELNERLNE